MGHKRTSSSLGVALRNLPDEMAGNAAQTSREMPAKIHFFRPVTVMAWVTFGSSNTHYRRAIDHWNARQPSTRKVGPHMVSRTVVVTTIGNFRALAALPIRLCFSSPAE
jgi:hypothetical protein